jgi:hypothetical protein
VDSIGKLTGLAPENPLSVRISKAYFLWQRTMPFADQVTSMPRKYFNFPKSLIRKIVRRNCLTWMIALRVLEVMITSST